MPPAEAGAPLPPWRAALAAALHRGRAAPESRYLQLATQGADGRARNRTVVFRGFGPLSEVLVLTDRRSAKYAELTRDPRAELCWYLPKSREQFRLLSRLDLHGDGAPPPWDALRQRLWEERGARGQAEWLAAIPASPLPVAVPEFILLACQVEHVDHLELKPTPQRQTRYACENGRWIQQSVVGSR